GTTGYSAIHEIGHWNRRLVSTMARHIFVFGRDFDPQPDSYRRLDDSARHLLTVWTHVETRRGAPITLQDLAEARLTRLGELAANEVLELSHVSAITRAQLFAIARMPNLQHLLLAGAPARDDEIAAMLWSGCRGLRSLYLDETSIGSASLRALASCSEL